MKYSIKVKTNAKENKVVKDKIVDFFVYTREPAIENKANESIIKILAKYFKVAKSQIKIIKGQKSKNKVIFLENEISH